ncbi:hypothetical protein ACJX0J_025050, partial [Zea mays]
GLTAITATQQPAIPSYLKALQSPAKAAHQQPKPPRPITAKAVCYRCLSPEHLVRACRDPVRCRNRHGYGHRSHDCKMPISQTLSPASHHRKTPTIPVPASRLPVHAVPFNYPAAKASSSTPPTPPSSPATQTYLDAYAPKNMLASSSSCPPDFMLPSAGASKASCMEGPLGLGRAALPKAHCSSPPRRMVDICIDSRNGKAPVEPVFAPSRSPSLGRRSPPSGPGSPVPRSAEEFIQNILRTAAPGIQFQMLPSSRGIKLLHFYSRADRDEVRLMSPLLADGLQLKLECPEETDNRFFRQPQWLAFAMIVDFPTEHWSEASIRRCFGACCEVAEVDPRCLTGDNFGPIRVLLELNHYLDLPSEIWVTTMDGVSRGGCIAQVLPLRVWPRADQLGPDGRLRRFFQHMSPPPAPPMLSEVPAALPHVPQQQNASPVRNAQQQANTTTSQTSSAFSTAQLLCLSAMLAQLTGPRTTETQSQLPPQQNTTPQSHCSSKRQPTSPTTFNATRHKRAGRPPRNNVPKPIQRKSSRLAAKANGNFVDMTNKAVKLKELRDTLQGCSTA